MNAPDRPTEELLQDFHWKIAQALATLGQEEACGEIADVLIEAVGDDYFEITNLGGDTDFLLSPYWREIHGYIVAAEEANPELRPTNLAEMQTNEYVLAEELQKIGKSSKKTSQIIIQMRVRKELRTHIAKKKKTYLVDRTSRWEKREETDEAAFAESIRSQVTRIITWNK